MNLAMKSKIYVIFSLKNAQKLTEKHAKHKTVANKGYT